MSGSETLEELRERFSLREIPCEICGSENQRSFQMRGRIAGPGEYGEMPVTICGRCGYKMQNPRYEDAFYEAYYDRMYRAVAFGAEAPSESYVNEQRQRGAGVLAFVAGHGVKPGIMLDHGCASGATMLAWQEAGWQTVGIDPHRPSVLSGRELGLEIEIAAGEKLPFENGRFDLILSLGSTEHSYDLARTMFEAHRVTKDGGFLFIRWRSNRIFGSPLEYYNHNHYRFFTPKTWRLCLERYGYSIVATTEEKLEGWDSYAYILARKTHEPGRQRIEDLIRQGEYDDPDEEVANLQALRESYRDACVSFVDLHEEMGDDPEKLIASIRSGEIDLPWGFLGGDPAKAVARSLMEAKVYLQEYDDGRVI